MAVNAGVVPWSGLAALSCALWTLLETFRMMAHVSSEH